MPLPFQLKEPPLVFKEGLLIMNSVLFFLLKSGNVSLFFSLLHSTMWDLSSLTRD